MKAAARKQQILDSALKAFAEHGYERTSIAIICESAGIARPTLYQYFKDKKSVFRELLISHVSKIHEKIHARQREKDSGKEISRMEAARSFHLELLKEISRNRDFFKILFKEAKARNAETEDIARGITRAIVNEFVNEYMAENGPEGVDIKDIEFAAVYMLGGTLQAVEYYLFDEKNKMKIEELAERITLLESKFIERARK